MMGLKAHHYFITSGAQRVTNTPGVGKTTIASILAGLLAHDDRRVLAIDCDPSMNLAMNLESGQPLCTPPQNRTGDIMD
jgi:CO dehydrogenase nickel-insertion accessory protein CooC1